MAFDTQCKTACGVVLTVAAIDTASVVVCGFGIKVASNWVVTTGDFIGFTYAVAIGVQIAVPIAVQRIEWKLAAAVLVGGLRIEVASAVIGAASNFEFITNAISVEV